MMLCDQSSRHAGRVRKTKDGEEKEREGRKSAR